jgi:hypothetical protein
MVTIQDVSILMAITDEMKILSYTSSNVCTFNENVFTF